jgi:hypothetical protein
MTHSWPARAEWQADAESFTRTLCYPRQRVPDRADHWLDNAELADVRAIAHRLAKTLRREITRVVNTLAPQFPYEPAGAADRLLWPDTLDEGHRADYKRLASARQDRLQLGRDVRTLDTAPTSKSERPRAPGASSAASPTSGEPRKPPQTSSGSCA